jgi:hypothetical protein
VAGLSLFFDYLNLNYPDVGWSFHSPGGEHLAGDYLHRGLSAAPTYPGTYWLAINNLSFSEAPYAFRMVPGNHAPVISAIVDLVVDEENTIEFTIVAQDVESPSDLLTFTLDPGAPDGASLDPTTGIFRWTPAEEQGPGEHVFKVRVTDDGIPSLASAETFTIQVKEVNRAPILVPIADQMIHAGGGLRLPIQATDPDIPGNAMHFIMLDGPPGASVDPSNGGFIWSSSLADAGMTFPVRVQATDNGSPALSGTAAFSVTVRDPLRILSIASSEGSFALSWFGIAGHRYLVQHKDRFGAPWLDLARDVPGSEAVVTFTDVAADTGRERYYRVADLR